MNDTKKDTEAILIFINYLILMIDKSMTSFETETFLKRVFDPYYVNSKEYSGLLVSDIPKRQRANIAVEVILRRKKGDVNALSFFIDSLFENLEEAELTRVYKVVSDELRYTENEIDIQTILKVFPAKLWDKIDKAVRLRIENILLRNAQSGVYNPKTDNFEAGTLSTWITDQHFVSFNKSNWSSLLVQKLSSGDLFQSAYAYKVLWSKICKINRDNTHYVLEYYVREALKKGAKDEELYIEFLTAFNIEICYDESHPWWDLFKDEIKLHPEIKYVDLPF